MPRLAAGVLLLLAAAAASGQPWPTYQHDAMHSGRGALAGPAAAGIVWTFPVPGQRTINIQPVVDGDGTVYFGTWGDLWSGDYARGQLFAVASDGTLRWQFDPGIADQPSQGQHPIWGTIEGVPVIDEARGRLYFGRGDNKLWAVSLATGELLWSFATYPTSPQPLPELGGQVISPPTQGPDGTLYFGTVPYTNAARTTLFAVSPEGEEVWRYELDGSDGIWGSPALGEDGTIYFTTWDAGGKVVALESPGPGEVEVVWELEVPGLLDTLLFHPTVAPDGTIYVPGGRLTGFCESRALVAAIDPAGTPRWGWLAGSPSEDIVYQVSLDADGSLVFGTASTQQLAPFCLGVADEGRLYRATDQGSRLVIQWSRNPRGAVMGTTVDAAGDLYAAVRGDWIEGQGGRVLALDRGGAPLWPAAVRVDGEIWWNPPTLAPGERIYVGTNPCADVLNILPCFETPALVAIGAP